MELKVKGVNHPGSKACVSRALYLLTTQKGWGGKAPLLQPPSGRPPIFDMLIVAVGRFELAREQKLSEG